MHTNCALCQRIEEFTAHGSPRLVREFEHSLLIVGDHQFFPGYCVLLLKNHAREMHELPKSLQEGLWRELMISAKAIADEYKPLKMNYASLGNQDPHLHWHILPRYQSDPHHKQHPWADAAHFGEHTTTDQMARHVAERLEKYWR